MNEEAAKPSLVKRLIALVVLAIAGFILLKLVIGFLAGMLTLVVIVVAGIAVIWALRTL
jgi:uncharacterized membrane protein YccC